MFHILALGWDAGAIRRTNVAHVKKARQGVSEIGRLPAAPGLRPGAGCGPDQVGTGGRRESGLGWPADEGEIAVSRFRLSLPWTVGVLVALASPAWAQNLDAGKPPSQIFSEVCANCHRSARELRGGASVSFLREHYTTGSDMASTMASYLASGAAGGAAAGSQPQPKRQPAPVATATPTRDTPSTSDAARDQHHPQQAADTKPLPNAAGTAAGPGNKLRAGS